MGYFPTPVHPPLSMEPNPGPTLQPHTEGKAQIEGSGSGHGEQTQDIRQAHKLRYNQDHLHIPPKAGLSTFQFNTSEGQKPLVLKGNTPPILSHGELWGSSSPSLGCCHS